MVSGSFSPPCSGYFSPFLHSTGSLSVFSAYLALRDGPRRFRQDSSCPALLRWLTFFLIIYAYGGVTLSTLPFQTVLLLLKIFLQLLQPRYCLNNTGLGSFLFARHYSGYRYFFLFLQVLRCFSSLRLLMFSHVRSLQLRGLPHSDTAGSIRVCQSPTFFAAFRVLLRSEKPRHPPFALCNFFFSRD